MALSERLAYILDFDVKGAVRSLEQVGKTADKEFGKTESKLDRVGSSLTKFGAGALAFAGVAGAGLAKLAEGAASTDANFSSLNQVMGETIATNIAKWAENGAQAVGLSNREIYSAATAFGQLGKVAGFTGAELETFTKRQVTLAADMAAFKDVTPTQAIQDLTAAYAGSSETLQKYNVFVNDTNIKAAIQKSTGEEVTGTLTSQQRVMGINLLLMEQTADITGQWARESGGLAGQQAQAKAELTNLADEIGRGAIPVMTKILALVRDGIGLFQGLNDATGGAAGKFAAFGVITLGIVGTLSTIAGQIIRARDRIRDFVDSLDASKVALVGVGLVLTAGIGIYQQYAAEKAAARARTDEFVTALEAEREGQEGATEAAIVATYANDTQRKTLNQLGISIADVARFIRGEQVPAIQALVKSYDPLNRVGTEFEDLTTEQAGAVRALIDQIKLDVDLMREANQVDKASVSAKNDLVTKTRDQTLASQRYVESLVHQREELYNNDEATAKARASGEGYVDMLIANGEAQIESAEAADEATEAYERQTAAVRRNKEITDELIGAKLRLVGGDIAVRQAARDATEASDDFNESLNEGFDDLGDYQEGLDKAALAQLGAAQAAADHRAEQMRARGEIVNSATEAELYKQELTKLAENLDGPLRDAILGYIAALDQIPASKTTVVTLEGGGRVTINNDRYDRPGQVVSGSKAASGSPWTGGDVTVGEHGIERVRLPMGSKVDPAWKTAQYGQSWPAGITINNYRRDLTPSDLATAMKLARLSR